MSANVSIIICTRNRASSLSATLAAVEEIHVPPDFAVELLVIDNGSTDETAGVVGTAAGGRLAVRRVVEPTIGLSHARNRGVAESTGDIIVFTDDDIRPLGAWLELMCRPIHQGSADAVVGHVVLARHLDRPWLRDYLRGFVACTDSIPDGHPVELVGANMAIRRSALVSLPPFDTDLGAGALGFGEETLLSNQLHSEGYRLVRVREAAVEHHPDASRITPNGMFIIAERLGRSHGYLAHHWEHRTIPWCRLRMAILAAALALRTALFGTTAPDGGPWRWRVDYLTRINLFRQYLVESKKPNKYRRENPRAQANFFGDVASDDRQQPRVGRKAEMES